MSDKAAVSADAIDRELTRRLLGNAAPNRLLALALFPLLGAFYGIDAPWLALIPPYVVHAATVYLFIALSRAYAKDPDALPTETWRRRYIALASATGVTFGIVAAVLVVQPGVEQRLAVCAAIAVAVALAPGRLFEPRSYMGFAGTALVLHALGLLMQGERLSIALAVGTTLYLAGLLFLNRQHHAGQREQIELALATRGLAERSAAAEKEARTAHDSLRDALEALPVAVAMWDSHDSLVLCNETFANRFNRIPEATTPGIQFSDAIRAVTYKMGLSPVGKEETFSDAAVALYRAGGMSEYRAGPDTWYRGETRHTPDGRGVTSIVDISELKRREKEATQSRAVLQSVFDNLTDGVVLFEPDGHWVYQNRAMAVLHDISDEKLATLPMFADIIRYRAERGDYGPMDQIVGGIEGLVARRVAHFNIVTDQPPERRRTPTGQIVEVTYRRLADGRVLTIHRDLTAIVEQEERLIAARAESERTRETLQIVLDNMTDGVMLFDKDFRWRFVNRQVMEFQRLTPEVAYPSASGFDILRYQARRGDFGPAAGKEQIEALVADRAAAMRKAGGNRYERRTASGRIVEFGFKPTPDGGTLAIYRDVTELRESERAAARARDRLQMVLDNMTDGVMLLDHDERWAIDSDRVRELLGVPKEVAHLGANSADIRAFQMARGDFSNPEEREAILRSVEAVRNGADTSYVRRTASGRIVEFKSRRLENGEVLVTYRDITELKEQQTELERARDEAQTANQAKSTFLATMSHEIRTPMNGVVGTAELLEREPLNERQRRLVGTVRRSAAALLRIIDDVLDFSKIEAGRMELEEAPCSLRALIEGTAETLSVQIEKKGLAISTAIEPGTPDALLADVTRLRQILFNLIGNASKFTDVGTITVRARALAVDNQAVTLALSIADTGIGMDEVQRARLFQPFAQADSSTTRRYGGTGLGLSIVRRLAELMGGDVTVDSAPGRGSIFTVTVRVKRATEAPKPRVTTVAPLAMPSAGQRVLAVDDYEVNLEVLIGQFGILGVELDTAANGIQALTLWREKPYALVLTDIHMPDMDGFELTRQIRAEETLKGVEKRTPIVALTANALKGEAERCLAAGMDDYLTKPLTLDRLRRAVAQWATSGSGVPEAASAAAAAGTAAIDRSVVAEMFGDNPAMIDRVLTRFSGAGAKLVAEMAAVVDQPKPLAELAHKLKGAARAAGAIRLGDLAAALEQSPNPAEVRAIEAEWQRVEKALSGG
ncbi:MAG: PAS-domain containing protein [Alphaproteobacteria bacterium]|nr:PAS-domain containing protein [Alphaproteobacteria bacterium]